MGTSTVKVSRMSISRHFQAFPLKHIDQMRSNGLLQEVDARLQLRLEDHQDYPRMESPEVWEVRRGLSPSCSRLQAVGSICLPASCDLYRVDFDDTCKDIINNHPRLDGIKLLNWNPNMNMVCGNIDSLWGGIYLRRVSENNTYTAQRHL